MKQYTFVGSRAPDALKALHSMAADSFAACFRVVDEQPDRFTVEDITDPNNMFAAAIEGILGDLPQVFGVTMTVEDVKS